MRDEEVHSRFSGFRGEEGKQDHGVAEHWEPRALDTPLLGETAEHTQLFICV